MTVQLLEKTEAPSAPRAHSRSRHALANVYVGRKTWNPSALRAEAAPARLRIAETDELPAVHHLAESVMGMRLAPLWSLASAHGHSTASAWVHEEPDPADSLAQRLTGLFLVLPLNWDGEAALRSGRFNFSTPRLDELCAPGDEIAAIYFWLSAGSDARARRNVMRTALAWVSGSNAGIRFYARAASLDGARALAGLQFRRLAPDVPNLFLLDQRR